MKKVLSVLLTVGMVATAFTGCGGNGSNSSGKTDSKDTNGDGKVKVGVVSMIENGAFTDMRDGIIDELKAQGYEDSQIEYKCAAGDSTALTTIVTNMIWYLLLPHLLHRLWLIQKQIHLYFSVLYQHL